MQIRNLGKAELGRGGMGPLTGRSGVELGQQEWRPWWDYDQGTGGQAAAFISRIWSLRDSSSGLTAFSQHRRSQGS